MIKLQLLPSCGCCWLWRRKSCRADARRVATSLYERGSSGRHYDCCPSLTRDRPCYQRDHRHGLVFCVLFDVVFKDPSEKAQIFIHVGTWYLSAGPQPETVFSFLLYSYTKTQRYLERSKILYNQWCQRRRIINYYHNSLSYYKMMAIGAIAHEILCYTSIFGLPYSYQYFGWTGVFIYTPATSTVTIGLDFKRSSTASLGLYFMISELTFTAGHVLLHCTAFGRKIHKIHHLCTRPSWSTNLLFHPLDICRWIWWTFYLHAVNARLRDRGSVSIQGGHYLFVHVVCRSPLWKFRT